jgi:TP901 family phage tail tape measure protein
LAGTSATDSAGRLRSTGSILDDVIKKYDSLSDKTLKVGLSQQVFGRGGAALLPFLEKGGDAIKKYREQAELLGIALDEKTVAAAKNFKGAINDYKAASEGATIQLTAGMLPAINQIINSMTKVHRGRIADASLRGDRWRSIQDDCIVGVQVGICSRVLVHQARPTQEFKNRKHSARDR